MRIVQISDTHISRVHDHFDENVSVVGKWLAANGADLIVNTGDLSMNGAVSGADLDDAAQWHRGLDLAVLSVPGNHDVGDVAELRADQILDGEKLERYREIVGPDRWTHDVAGWRLVGFNAMLLGTGHPEEKRQYEWLEAALATTGKVALFLHKPLFLDGPGEGPRGYWTVPPGPRARLLDLLGRADLRLVASGYLHVALARRFGDAAHVWGPSAAFVCGPSQMGVPGDRRIGIVVHDFDEAGVSSRFVFPTGAENTTIDPHLATIYPPPARALASA